MSNKSSVVFVLIIVFLLLSSLFVSATVIGANKGVINFRNVLKNGYAQELVTLTTDADYPISVTYKAEGDIVDWVSFEPSEQPFYIQKDDPYTIAIIVQPPADLRNDNYAGSVRFVTGALAGPDGQFGTAVRTAINLRMGVALTGQEIVSCRISGQELDDVEEGYPLEFYSVIANNGNVRIRPDFTLEFWNQDQTELVDTFTFSASTSILPTTQERIFHSFDHDLPIGQYWVKIKSECGGGFLTMSVIERGGVSDKGELVKIEHESWVKTGDIVPIDAVFKNLGSRIVSAKFKGTIDSIDTDEIVKIVDTDSLDVSPGEVVKLRTYFNPVNSGQYMVKGRVLYNKKLTFEKSSVLNVNPSGKAPIVKSAFNSTTIFIVIIVVAILTLLILISKKKRKIKRHQIKRHQIKRHQYKHK